MEADGNYREERAVDCCLGHQNIVSPPLSICNDYLVHKVSLFPAAHCAGFGSRSCHLFFKVELNFMRNSQSVGTVVSMLATKTSAPGSIPSGDRVFKALTDHTVALDQGLENAGPVLCLALRPTIRTPPLPLCMRWEWV